jgi:hypothetical protein
VLISHVVWGPSDEVCNRLNANILGFAAASIVCSNMSSQSKQVQSADIVSGMVSCTRQEGEWMWSSTKGAPAQPHLEPTLVLAIRSCCHRHLQQRLCCLPAAPSVCCNRRQHKKGHLLLLLLLVTAAADA